MNALQDTLTVRRVQQESNMVSGFGERRLLIMILVIVVCVRHGKRRVLQDKEQ
jgi:hypothetical protein